MRIGQDKDGPQTIIGKTVTVKGEILGTEQLVVEGTVEGRIMIETSVFIREGGLVKADVDANIINVAGGVVGNISVKDKIEIVTRRICFGGYPCPQAHYQRRSQCQRHHRHGRETPKGRFSLPL